MHQVRDARRNGFPLRNGEVIRAIHGRLLPFGLPCFPTMLEVPTQLLLLAIDGNGWLSFGLRLSCLADTQEPIRESEDEQCNTGEPE